MGSMAWTSFLVKVVWRCTGPKIRTRLGNLILVHSLIGQGLRILTSAAAVASSSKESGESKQYQSKNGQDSQPTEQDEDHGIPVEAPHGAGAFPGERTAI